MYNFKIYLFSFLNTKQTSDGIFSKKTEEIWQKYFDHHPISSKLDMKTYTMLFVKNEDTISY